MSNRSIAPEGRGELKKEVGAVSNAIHILRHLARAEEPEGVAAIARATNVSPSSAFNILRTLAHEQIVSFDADSKVYRLGPGLSELAVAFVGRSYTDLIQPELDRLSLNESILIVLWQVTERGNIRSIARSVPNVAHLDVKPNSHLPELIGAAGRCIAVARNYHKDELRRRFSTLRWDEPPDFEAYLKDVNHARKHGWATDIGNLYSGVTTIASVVHDGLGAPRFAISGIGISAQFDARRVAEIGAELTRSANFVSRALFPSPSSRKENDIHNGE